MAARTTVSLDWNEVLIARMHQGQLTCWTAWRRSIQAFDDPATWDDPTTWATHFTQQPAEATWGFEGYGLIAVDMDRKVLWSINDYSVPGQVHLPMTSLVVDDPKQAYAGLRGLVQRPSHWDHVTFEAIRTDLMDRLPGREPKEVTLRLTDLLEPGMDVDTAIERLTQDRGSLKVGAHHYMVLGGTLAMPGWTVRTDRGESSDEVALALLADLKAGGWPPPDWDNLKNHLTFEEYDEEDAPDLDAMAEAWSEPAMPTARSRPSRQGPR